MTDGVVLLAPDERIEREAKRHKLGVVVSSDMAVPFDRALIVTPGVTVPWHLVDYGFHFLERWDAAAPLWRYGVLAQDVGTPSDRERTEGLVRDLRVPLYACELLFVRASEAGKALVDAWREEQLHGQDVRLAFMRALYQVKPIFCALPRSWLGDAARQQDQAVAHRAMPSAVNLENPRVAKHLKVRPSSGGLVRVEIAPGVYVRCKPGDEEQVYQRLSPMGRTREERRNG